MRSARRRLGVSDAADCAQLRAIDAHDLIHLEQHGRIEGHAVQRQVAHFAGDRSVLMPSNPDADRMPRLHAPKDSLARVLEPMALGGIERARTAAAFVVALELALDSVRR